MELTSWALTHSLTAAAAVVVRFISWDSFPFSGSSGTWNADRAEGSRVRFPFLRPCEISSSQAVTRKAVHEHFR